MAKTVPQTQKKPSGKAVAAVTLAVLLALTIAATVIGITGMRLGSDGLYKLLAWIPTPTHNTTWRQALVPSPELGDTMVQTYAASALTEGEAVSDAQLAKAADILARRLSFGGWEHARVEVTADKQLLLTLPQDGTHDHAYEMLTGRGEVAFAGPDGEVFLTQDNVVNANYGINPQDGSVAIGFQLDRDGTRIFGEKTAQLIGQTMSLMVDGVAVASPGISEPLTQGQASLPGFNGETGVAYASMLRTEPLPITLRLQGTENGAPILGAGTDIRLLTTLYIAVALIALAFVWRYRLSGVIALWLMVIQLVATFFLAALLRAGFSVSTLVAVFGSFALFCAALIMLFRSMREDLSRGRAITQAIKDAFGKGGKTAVDVMAALLLVALVLIIVNQQAIGAYMRVFAMGVLVNLVLFTLALRWMLGATVSLFGAGSKLYAPRGEVKETA